MVKAMDGDRIFSVDVANKRMEVFGLTQEKMAFRLGISVCEMKRIEGGEIPKTRIFLHVCKVMGLNPMDYHPEVLTKVNCRNKKRKQEKLNGDTSAAVATI